MFAAIHAGIPKNRAMELQHIFATCFLMQAVNILSDDCCQLSLLLQTSKGKVCRIWFCIRINHFIKIKVIKLLGITHEKSMTQHGLRGKAIFFLLINSLITAEVGDIGFRADTRSPEKHDSLTVFDDFSQFLTHGNPSLRKQYSTNL